LSKWQSQSCDGPWLRHATRVWISTWPDCHSELLQVRTNAKLITTGLNLGKWITEGLQ
jgi:hypothetical protein